jgi:hypothetical protein
VDLDARVIVIGQQRIAYGHTVAVGPPKTASSRRVIALDKVTARLLRTHLGRQRAERQAAGDAWQDSGYVFTTPDGAPLHPDYLTRRFHRLVELSGLPPVRLHDLRHGAATLAHAPATATVAPRRSPAGQGSSGASSGWTSRWPAVSDSCSSAAARAARRRSVAVARTPPAALTSARTRATPSSPVSRRPPGQRASGLGEAGVGEAADAVTGLTSPTPASGWLDASARGRKPNVCTKPRVEEGRGAGKQATTVTKTGSSHMGAAVVTRGERIRGQLEPCDRSCAVPVKVASRCQSSWIAAV